ncbi:MAG: NUDIX domain-containing protein [Promethearchaeati archaeon]
MVQIMRELIRNSVKAIIIENNKILFTKNKDESGIFYLLPGGGQEPGENMKDALRREVYEETGAEIYIDDIKYVREYIGVNHEFSEYDEDVHQIEYMFICQLKNISDNQVSEPDSMQIGIEWMKMDNIETCRIYPKILKSLLMKDGLIEEKVYLGDIN